MEKLTPGDARVVETSFAWYAPVVCILKSAIVLCVLQDVRPEEEFNVSHISGAVRVEPGSEPDLQALGITRNTPGERE